MLYEPFSVEITTNELPRVDSVINQVDEGDGPGWLVAYDTTAIFVPAFEVYSKGRLLRAMIEPRVGDRLRLYGLGGTDNHGIQINEDVVFYRDQDQRSAYRRRQMENDAARSSREYTLTADERAAQYAQLPAPFRRRIDDIRSKSDFQVFQETEELFILTEATKVALYCRSLAAAENDLPRHQWEILMTFGGSRSVLPAWQKLHQLGVIDTSVSEVQAGPIFHYAQALLEYQSMQQEVPTP